VINYQGSLVDSTGIPVTGEVNLAFRFYDGPDLGATALPTNATEWSELHPNVEVTSGRFSVQLGSLVPLPAALFDDRAQLWLDVTVDDETLSPRVQIASVPFALEAQSVVSGAAVRSVNGVTDDVVLRQGDNVTITQESNELTISAVGPDGGLSSVIVEEPLTGDGTSGAPIQLPDGAITTAKLADNAVTTDIIQNETITNAKLAANAAVLSLNGVRGDVTLQGSGGAEVSSSGNTITVSAVVPDGGLTSVSSDGTLAGNGTSDSPLGLADDALVGGDDIGISRTGSDAFEISFTGEVSDGDITGVSAGAGLSGGGTSGNVELSIENGDIVGSMLDGDAIEEGANIDVSRSGGNFVIAAPDALTSAVTTLNGLSGGVTIEGGGNIDVSSSGNALQIDFTGNPGGGGDITEVAAGTGLTGGGDEGEVTLGIANGGVDTPQLADESITAAKLNAGDPSSGDFLKYIDGELEWTDDLFSDATTSQPSSIRWKEAVRTLEDPLRLVEQLRGVRYTWTESGESDVGVIAEEVAEVLPEVVVFESDGQARGVNYGKLVSVLIEAAKAQQQDLDAKEQTIAQQQKDIGALRARVARLEQLVQQQLSAASGVDENSPSASDKSVSPGSYR
jgi:hypothetical protein